jgi:hypothetical protein
LDWDRLREEGRCARSKRFAEANDLAAKSHVEIREAIGDKFPKHIYHSIICIGALIAHWQYDSQAARSTQMSQKK